MEKPLPMPETERILGRLAQAQCLYRLHHPVCRYMHNFGNQYRCNELLSYISEVVGREQKLFQGIPGGWKVR